MIEGKKTHDQSLDPLSCYVNYFIIQRNEW